MRGYAPEPVTHHGSRGDVRRYETTRYELIAERGAERHLITYSARKTQQALVNAIFDHVEAIRARLDLEASTANEIEGKGDRLVIVFPNGWRIRWSHRTEREAVQDGEYAGI